jgi:hypothetical protein
MSGPNRIAEIAAEFELDLKHAGRAAVIRLAKTLADREAEVERLRASLAQCSPTCPNWLNLHMHERSASGS